MPVTQLDPKSTLIVVDLQKGIVSLSLTHPVADAIAQTRKLLDAFRAAKQTDVLVNVAGVAPGRTETLRPTFNFPAGWTDLIPELNAQPDDVLITKHTWGAFTKIGLEETLRERGVTQVVITGIATSSGVEATARQAYEVGFNVALATDAMIDRRKEAHDYSIANVFPRLGEIGTTDEIVALLSGR
ncbi:isochorismatase family protein [Microvirga puerhi]|uniref:Isochorismatase family protein n=1 Tax=Microvirga puerhi TaxID=2876078 RepID=A0ABS7VSY7_9HYPH|nr:isochorismatase family protein [Microvirga puerhi]MBZ6078673.1 isochorismatase family protein [Microvirga puerhi]